MQGQAKDVRRFCAGLNGLLLGLSVKIEEADEVVVGAMSSLSSSLSHINIFC